VIVGRGGTGVMYSAPKGGDGGASSVTISSITYSVAGGIGGKGVFIFFYSKKKR
jgi:hypothetical protein